VRQPLDLRVETPPGIVGENRERLREVVRENLLEMEMRQSPVRAIIGGSHNTSRFNDRTTHQAQNLDWVVRHTRELAAEHRLEFTPAPFADMLADATRIGAY
jgi:hypothetical protein